MRNRVVGWGILAVGLLLGFMLWPTSHPPSSEPSLGAAAVVAESPATGASESGAALAWPINALNSSTTTIQNDVRLLLEVFTTWQTNFAATGNPIGTNAEITAALCGNNPLQLDLIPRDHPAINARGELCDRWGTPVRFHQLSGTEMQIISAGPDRDFATADDVTTP